jgi:hypothetical protein
MIFVALMLAASAPADPVLKARQGYAGCLTTFTNDAIDKKMAKDAFVAGLKSKCADKEAPFRDALVAADKADGMSEADATGDANDQIAEYIAKMTDDFDSAR